MRIQDLVAMGKEYLMLGLVVAFLFLFLYFIGYFGVYRKLMHGEKRIPWKKLIWKLLFVIYLTVVIGVTLLGRFDVWQNGMIRPLFYSYKEAWYSGKVTEWSNLVLNICMFVPFGFLVSLAIPKINQFWKAYLAGAATTIIIELIQLVLHRGIFELDDVMNNFFGTMIGYGILRFIVKLFLKKERQAASWKKIALLQIPLFVTVGFFSIISISYNQMELGTLSSHYIQRVKLENGEIESNMKFQDQEKNLPVYKVKMLSEEETREIADKVFKMHDAGIDSTRDDIYTETAVYYSDDGNRYSIWIDYKGGSFHFVDFKASFPEDDSEVVYKTMATETEIRQMLLEYAVEVPEKVVFENCGDGTYQFTAQMTEDGAGYVYDGVITCKLTENGEFTDVTNSMMAYVKYKDFQCISEMQAYNEALDGKFRQGMPAGKLTITQLEIQYQIDSKGYVQPVYVFDNENQDNGIVIPALK